MVKDTDFVSWENSATLAEICSFGPEMAAKAVRFTASAGNVWFLKVGMGELPLGMDVSPLGASVLAARSSLSASLIGRACRQPGGGP